MKPIKSSERSSALGRDHHIGIAKRCVICFQRQAVSFWQIEDMSVSFSVVILQSFVEAFLDSTVHFFTAQVERVMVILEVDDREVTLDANHPLAGQDLTFALRLDTVE